MSFRLEFSEIHRELRASVRGWGEAYVKPGAALRDETSSFDEALYYRLDSELGIMNISLPESVGGCGLDVAATILCIEALSEFDPGFAMSYLSQELLFSHQLYWSWFNSGREMPRWHADILKRKRLSGMAMTEPEAGTDVLGMRTTAVHEDGCFVLNGVKQWITNGPNGEAFLVYARTGEGRRDISLFLVTSDTEGLTRTSCEKKMGMRSSPTGILTFQNCRIPEDSLVGELHEGLRPMIRNLAVERLGLAAESCGIARACFDVMRAYASERHAFGHAISEFGQIQEKIAGGYAAVHAMRAFLYDSLHSLLGNEKESTVLADGVKLFCARTAEALSRDAIQVLGANGYSSAYPVERLHRDAVLLSIGGGTNEALEKNITRQLMR